MRICIIGKFPPIQGGVSARTYWTAHGLAARGHEVHVVTNAKEAAPPFRMHMRRQDWKRCGAAYEPSGCRGTGGSVTVHWTDPVDNSQFYIPMASAFVSKLAGMAAQVHSEHPFDAIYSHYLEPYGVAGHLAASIAGVPHVARMAGSDAGRLWRHPQFEALYDHVLRSAALVIATGIVAGRAIKHGVRPERIAAVGRIDPPEELFCPEGPALDLAALRREVKSNDPELRHAFWGAFTGDLPYFGIFGKLGETKGSFALLAAMQRLKQSGIEVGLLAMAHGRPALESKFRAGADELGLADRVLQIPFLPHWRVPEFLRSCLAVCCLEQDFPIIFHTPVIAREVLACGGCLVGSTEVIRKLPDHERLPDGFGCVAIEDVRDVDVFSARLAAIARDPEPLVAVAARGRAFARMLQTGTDPHDRLEELLKSVTRKRPPSRRRQPAVLEAKDPRFPITQTAARALAMPPQAPIDLPQAREVLATAERGIREGDANLRPVASAIRLEIAIAEVEEMTDAGPPADGSDLLFRLHTRRWALGEGDLGMLVPVRHPQLRLITVNLSDLLAGKTGSSRAAKRTGTLRHVAAFARANGACRDPLFVTDRTARILELSDGVRTALEIATELGPDNKGADIEQRLRQVEDLFVAGLLLLKDGPVEQVRSP